MDRTSPWLQQEERIQDILTRFNQHREAKMTLFHEVLRREWMSLAAAIYDDIFKEAFEDTTKVTDEKLQKKLQSISDGCERIATIASTMTEFREHLSQLSQDLSLAPM